MTVTIKHKGSVTLGYTDRCNDPTCECNAGQTFFPVTPPSPPRHDAAFNHPAHYGGVDNPYEVIKVIEAWKLGFHLGTAVKYIPRAGIKDSATEIEDLEKSIWYIRRRIQKLQEEQDKAAKASEKGSTNAN